MLSTMSIQFSYTFVVTTNLHKFDHLLEQLTEFTRSLIYYKKIQLRKSQIEEMLVARYEEGAQRFNASPGQLPSRPMVINLVGLKIIILSFYGGSIT
jgi:hypothetical protein